MFKTIVKTALKTLLLIVVLALVAFGVASLGFPSKMADLCEKTGNYYMAVGYANLSYTYTKDVNELNRCFVDSVYSKDDSKTVKYGDKLIAHEKFEEVCESTSSLTEVDYKQYVYGRVAAAKYRKGKKDEAFNLAVKAMEDATSFPKNNALGVLSVQVIESGDKDTAAKLLAEVQKFTPADGEADYFDALVAGLSAL